MCVTKIKLLGIVLASVGVLAGGSVALRGPGGAWTAAQQAAAAEPDTVVGRLVRRDAGPVSSATLDELKKLLSSSDPEVRRSAAALLKRLQSQTKEHFSVVASLDTGTVGAKEGWVLVNDGKDGTIVLRPAGKPAKPGDTTRELVISKKDGRWVAEEVLGLKVDVRHRVGFTSKLHLDRGVAEDANAPQAQLADLEKKMRALSDELEALRRQMKQSPRKE